MKNNYLKNIYYFWLGLAIMAVAKIKNEALGYRRPRVISKNNMAENLEYDRRVFCDFQKNIEAGLGCKYDLTGKDILEIGPGPDLGTGLLFMLNRAKSYTGIDKYNLLGKSAEFYRYFCEIIGKEMPSVKGVALEIGSALKENSGEVRLDNFQYLNIPIRGCSQALGKKYDLIFSNAVLEHIGDMENAFFEMGQLLREGGMAFHIIDFQTHSRHIRDKDPLNILRYPKRLYEIFRFGESPNRIRMKNYISFARAAGFKEIKTVEISNYPLDDVKTVKKHLARPFGEFQDEELKYLSAALIAKK